MNGGPSSCRTARPARTRSMRAVRAAAAAFALCVPTAALSQPHEAASSRTTRSGRETSSQASSSEATPPPAGTSRPASAPPALSHARDGSLAGAAAALVPGFLLHGAGHYVAGERDDAWRLFAAEGVGLLAFAGGMAVLAVSGAADPLAPVYVVPTVSGFSVFALSWLVDVVGAARGARPWPLPPPEGSLALTAGYVGLYGTSFDFRHDLGLAATWRGDRTWVSPWALVDPGGLDYYGLGARAGYVVWRPASEPVTRLSVVAGLGYQRFGADRFRVLTGEAYAELRLDLGRVTSTMRNAYFLWRLGAGVEAFGYDARPSALEDVSPLLVVDAGLGLQATRTVGLEAVYHQQKNELPGGLLVGGGIDGFLGDFELDGRIELAPGWTLLPGLRWGGGWMPWIALESRVY